MGQGINVLIVDYNKDECNIIKDCLLNHDNINVIGAVNDTVSALKLLKVNEVDLILIDISIPHITGLNLLNGIKKMEPKKIPKVIISSYIEEKHVIKDTAILNIDYFINKPINFKELKLVVEKLFL